MKIKYKSLFISAIICYCSFALIPVTLSVNYEKIIIELENNGKSGILTVKGYIKTNFKRFWNKLTDIKNPCQSEGIINNGFKIIKKDTFESSYRINFPLSFSNRSVTVKMHRDNKKHIFSWNLINGDVRKNSGYYQLQQINAEYSFLIYRVDFDPKMNFVPGWLVRWIIKARAPKIIHELRNCASSL